MLMVFRLLTVFHMQITAYRHAGGVEGRLAFGGDDELAYFMNNDCDHSSSAFVFPVMFHSWFLGSQLIIKFTNLLLHH